MSLKGQLQPHLLAALTSRRLDALRLRLSEASRRFRGRPHRLRWFHQVDDPHAWLLAQALPGLLERFPEVELEPHTIPEPPEDAVPAPELWRAWGMRDAAAIAPFFDGLDALPRRPEPDAVLRANARLLKAQARGGAAYLAEALEVGARLQAGDGLGDAPVAPGEVQARLKQEEATLRRGGHYLGGVLGHGDAWFWGVDRLPFLEARLKGLGLGTGAPPLQRAKAPIPDEAAREVEVFVSVRSPYSYIVLERALALIAERGLEARLRPVLPMVTRGLQVPFTKRLYIVLDVARLARRQGVPFGHISDPLGDGVERALAVWAQARLDGQGEAFLAAAMRGCWSEGVELASERGLMQVATRAGVSAEVVRRALNDASWRDVVEENRRVMTEELRLWGVPSFRWGERVAWGQDRLWWLLGEG